MSITTAGSLIIEPDKSSLTNQVAATLLVINWY